ncbi:MAG: DUF3244 domain-containing protein [Flammeovirgaceae bacterium]
MKSMIIKVVAVVATVVAIASSSFAAGGGDAAKVKVELFQRKGKVIALHFEKPDKEVIKIKIYDTTTNKVVFTGSKKKHDLGIIRYDMSRLPEGSYKIEVSSNNSVFSKEFEF